ncbi:MAG: aldehyde dehydrogenase family protein [Chthoniobacteraceae bacterium]
MNVPSRLLIGGRWVATDRQLPVVNPFTGEIFAQAPLGDASQLRDAVAAADACFPGVRTLPSHQRAALLRAVADQIQERANEFAETIVAEAGKPITSAETEVARCVMTFQVAAEEAGRAHGEVLPMDALPPGEGHVGLTRRFPVGVVAAITPFNFPLNLVAHKVAPCLATGNTMVVKPASKTPLTALLLAEVLVAAGMPEGQVNFVTCDSSDIDALVLDERVRKVTFTGSPAVGWELKRKCADKRVTLELGGNAGCIVHTDADLEAAVRMIATGAFSQAGQSCISVQRIVVHQDRYDEFRAQLLNHLAARIKTGDPRDRQTVVAPMITATALDKIRQRIAEAIERGARIVHGGGVKGNCLEATVIEEAPVDCELCTEEAFAPIVTLHRYRDIEEAIAIVNNSRFGLQAGVFTRDLPLAMHAFETLEVGGVMINQVPTFRIESMPYGGVKRSGFGREGLRYAMEEMTELRSLIIKL